jgi:hypothetical protein
MFYVRSLLSFLKYLVTPATKATGPKPGRWLALSLIAIPFVILIGGQSYDYMHTQNYQAYASKTLPQELEALQVTGVPFSESLIYCKHYRRSILMYCGANVANGARGLDFDTVRQHAQANGWHLVTASQDTGTPDTGWLRYADYTKDNKCLSLRETDGPGSTQVRLALDHECPKR